MINIDQLSKDLEFSNTGVNKTEALQGAIYLNQAEWVGRYAGFMVGLFVGGGLVLAVCNWVYYFGGYAK